MLGTLGLASIVQTPEILAALDPYLRHPPLSRLPRDRRFVALGAVFLAVTGAEALYADMGHLGKRAIRNAWLFFVLPALLLNYFGQGAAILQRSGAGRVTRSIPCAPRLGALSDGGRWRRVATDHRLAGGDIRRLFHHASGGAARAAPAHGDAAYLADRVSGQIYVPRMN